MRRGKLKPETEAKRLLAALRPHDSRNPEPPSCGMKIAATAIALALAALSGSTPEQEPGPQVVPDAHVWNYGDIDRTCLRWTDGCVVCDRGSLCSNIGFACTPQDRVLCLHRE